MEESRLTLCNKDGIFQVRWRWVVIIHLVCDKNNVPGGEKTKITDGISLLHGAEMLSSGDRWI